MQQGPLVIPAEAEGFPEGVIYSSDRRDDITHVSSREFSDNWSLGEPEIPPDVTVCTVVVHCTVEFKHDYFLDFEIHAT